jgi:hypothetical protein
MVQLGGGIRVYVSDEPVTGEGDAVQLIAQAHYDHEAEWVALRADRLGDDFFELRTGLAGGITQKFVNYRMKLAVVGDISERLAGSTSLADWVRESNGGRDLWFVPDLQALGDRLENRQ